MSPRLAWMQEFTSGRKFVARSLPLALSLFVVFASSADVVGADRAPKVCRAITQSDIPDAALCRRRFSAASAETAGHATDAKANIGIGGRLLANADADIHRGDFERAQAALDCARAHDDSRDWRASYEILRRYAVLEFRRERIDRALIGFECALAIAEANEDRAAIGKQAKNIGAALLRLGDYSGAQDALERSVSIQRAGDDRDIGSALNNLGDLYREKKDLAVALRYYSEALSAYRRRGDDVEAAHTMETMSVIALDQGDSAAANDLLSQALDAYRIAGEGPYRLRVYAGLAHAAMVDGDTRTARRWSADGLAFAAERKLTLPAPLQLQTARIDRAEGRSTEAVARLQTAVASVSGRDPDRIALLEELGGALADLGQYPQAIAALRDANRFERQDAQSRFDRQTGWQRSRFEAAERERRIAQLEHDNLRRRLWLWLVSVSALALLLSAGLLTTRHRQRARIAEAERRARDREIMERYRREVEALQIDRRLLRAMLATHDEALCLLDAEGSVLAANAKACALLGATEDGLLGNGFAMRLRDRDRTAWTEMLDHLDETGRTGLRLETNEGMMVATEIAQWEQDGGVLSLSLRLILPDLPAYASAAGGAAVADTLVGHRQTQDEHTQEAQAADAGGSRFMERTASSEAYASTSEEPPTAIEAAPPSRENDEDGGHDHYRRELVALMLASIEAWERATATSRIELAERSRIWRVNIDDGRLRARVMERYLALSKLPQNPRWRDVLRTAYFVLSNASLQVVERDALQARIDRILAYRRHSALA
jgi:two-component system, sensor histidine kinase ChiS